MGSPAMPDLAIIIVSWNVWDDLRACLHAIQADTRPDPHHPRRRRFGPQDQAVLQILVVDNASQDATRDLLPVRFPWVSTLWLPENQGFTRANNRGLAALGFAPVSPEKGHAPAPERLPRAVFFLNPDTEVLPGGLWTLYSHLMADPTIGAMGPQLRYGDGSLQSSRRRFPTRLTGFFESTWLGRLWPDNPWARRYHMADWSPAVRQDVDWVVGAALMVRREALQQVGGFDEGFFMYSEEMDLCRRLRLAGYRVVYEPAAVVVHHEARSSEQVGAWRHRVFNRSKVRYYRKWFGPLWAELLRRYLLLEFGVQLGLEWMKAVVGHRAELRRARIAAYRQVLADGLHPDSVEVGPQGRDADPAAPHSRPASPRK